MLSTQNEANLRGHEASSALQTGPPPTHGFLTLSAGQLPGGLAAAMQLVFINIVFWLCN